jgi:hypothetical protein
MRSDVRDALESARTVGIEGRRGRSFVVVQAVVLAVIRELPDDMSLNELRDEIETIEHEAPTIY